MSTQFTNRQWRLPNNENKDKVSNYSMKAPNTNSRINISTPANVGITSSFSFWLKRTNNTVVTQPYRISTGTLYYGMYMSGTSTIYVRYGAGYEEFNSTATQNALALTDWVHWVITRKEVTSATQDVKLYANGNLVDSASGTSNLSTYDSEIDYLMWSLQTTDSMDSFSIFDYALSSSQVTTLYGSSSTGIGNPMSLSPKPVACYPLGDQDAFNGADYLVPNSSLKDYVFDFNTGDYIQTPTILTNASQATFNIWVNFNDTSTSSIFGKGTGNDFFSFYTWSTGVLYFWMKDNGVAGEATVNPFKQGSSIVNISEWNMLTVVFDGTQTGNDRLKIYLNGGSNNIITGYTGTIPATLTNTTDNFWIGKFTSSEITNSKLSNFQAFDSVLSSTDIETLYNYGSPIRTLANIPQNSNLKAWYKLDASEIYNSSSTEWSIDNNQNPSAYPSSLDFVSSESDYIQIPYNVSLTPQNENFTISAWINTDNLSGWRPIWCTQNLSSNTPIVALHTFGDKVRATVGGSTNNPSYGGSWALLLDSTQSLTTSTWYHIAVSYNMSGNAQIYINGSPDNSGPIENPQTSWNTGDRFIGEGEGYWDGRISNLSIWNTALTSAQVTEIYNNGTPSNLSSHSVTSNLISWWKLNNLTTGIEDSKGSNNGTNNGATEYPGFVNTLVGDSSGMSQANLVQSDLSFTSGYSPYALAFDGANDWITVSSFMSNLPSNDIYTISTWIKTNSDTNAAWGSSNTGSALLYAYVTNGTTLGIARGSVGRVDISNALTVGEWANLVAVFDTSTNLKIYINNVFIQDVTVGSLGAVTDDFKIGGGLNAYPLDCSQSNFSIWNTALTFAQVSEIYNEGVPSNLNNHSAYSNLVSWWQLGSNTSWLDPYWIALDEKGTNNGQSQNVAAPNNMGENAIVDGVGSYANGVSVAMSDNIVGDAPYSSSNSLSVNMDVLDRVTDTPS